MNKRLANDLFIRRIFQAVVIGGLVALLLLQAIFLFALTGRRSGWFSEVPFFQALILRVLEFPFDQEFASLTTVVAGIIPMIVSTVCFKTDPQTHLPTEDFNRVGHTGIALLIGGVFLGLVTIAVAGMFSADVAAMTGADETAPARIAIRNTLSAILAFQAFYAVQLLGVKK